MLLKSALIGDPVAQSVSPKIFEKIAEHLGLPPYHHTLIRLPAGSSPESLRGNLERLRSQGYIGANITKPHKILASQVADRIEKSAAASGSVNIVTFKNGEIVASNTDGPAMLLAIEQAARWVKGRRAIILGAGGAARAIAHSLASFVSAITIVNRTESRAHSLAESLRARHAIPVTAISLAAFRRDLSFARSLTADAQLIIQATSVGMAPNSDISIIENIHLPNEDTPETVYADVIYAPRRTRFLQHALDHKGVLIPGISMLVCQASLAFQEWTNNKVEYGVFNTPETWDNLFTSDPLLT